METELGRDVIGAATLVADSVPCAGCACACGSAVVVPAGVICFPINAPGMGSFQLLNLVGYS